MNRLSLIIIALLAVISLNSCGEKIESAAAAKNIVPVQKVKVESALITEPIITSGRLISEAETKLSFKIPGIVKKIYVNEGDAVKKGKIIASLDLSEINAQFNQAKNGYEKAVRDFERVKKLHDEEVATLEQLQNTETALSISKSQLEIAQFNLDHSKITAPSDGTILRKLVEENELTNAGYPAVIFGSTSKSW
ncbi:MAG: efflux RND transporter periplasmic adaptor subunit, partial [Melioribacteraceae bacterium]|nr:efflux RND transporter periplasmic adaptor subunit [Melioribacteraceae bacterium]